MPLHNSASSSASGRPSIELITILVVCAIIFAVPTLLNNDYLLNKLARYLVSSAKRAETRSERLELLREAAAIDPAVRFRAAWLRQRWAALG